MAAGALAHRRVVVTRPRAQALGLIESLYALGAEPVVVPLIEIGDPSDGGAALAAALDRLADYDWLVVSSPNGAARVAPALAALAGRPDRPRVAAVGTATADALGVDADLVPDRQIAEGLVEAFPEGSGTGKVLVSQAEQARPVLADGIEAKGWIVDRVVAYRTETVRPSGGDLLAALAADAVLFASGSAVRAWVDVFGTSTPPLVVAIGPATAAVAEQIGLKVDAIAADHSVSGLLDCLLTHLGVWK